MKGFPRMLYMHLTTTPQPLPNDLDLSKKTAIITGGNDGLGLEVAKDLAARRIARLILSARSTDNEALARQEISEVNPACKVELWTLDYENYASMLAFGEKAAALDRLDIVILNAGVRQLKYTATATRHEQNLQVNHIGTALLSLLLYPPLMRTAKEHLKPSRLTIVTSIVHWWTPFRESSTDRILSAMDEPESMAVGNPHDRYGTSKLLQILWTRQLAGKIDRKNVVVNTVDPGLCKSNLHRYEDHAFIHVVSANFSWTAEGGGHNIASVAVVQGGESHGAYVSSEQQIQQPSDFVVSDHGAIVQNHIWDETIALLGRKFLMRRFRI